MSAFFQRWAGFWRREPLLSYAIGGGLVFLLLSPYLPSGKQTIVLDSRTIDAVLERRTAVEARELTEEEREQAIEEHVREEILLREAYRHGWHLEDGRVRQRLVLAMRSALLEDLPEPSLAQLRAFYQANAERYRTPVAVTFSHVFFANDSPPTADASSVLRSLNEGADPRGMGDEFWLGSTLVRQTRHQLAGALGTSFADEVFALEHGKWAGPFASNRGKHFVRLLSLYPETLPEFDAVERFVRVDWLTQRHEEIRERKMSRIRERYTVRGAGREPSS
jgi:hypothetical protein